MVATAGELVFGTGSFNAKPGVSPTALKPDYGSGDAGKQKNHSTRYVEWFFA